MCIDDRSHIEWAQIWHSIHLFSLFDISFVPIARERTHYPTFACVNVLSPHGSCIELEHVSCVAIVSHNAHIMKVIQPAEQRLNATFRFEWFKIFIFLLSRTVQRRFILVWSLTPFLIVTAASVRINHFPVCLFRLNGFENAGNHNLQELIPWISSHLALIFGHQSHLNTKQNFNFKFKFHFNRECVSTYSIVQSFHFVRISHSIWILSQTKKKKIKNKSCHHRKWAKTILEKFLRLHNNKNEIQIISRMRLAIFSVCVCVDAMTMLKTVFDASLQAKLKDR